MSSIRHSPLLPLCASCVMTQQHLYQSEIDRATCTPQPQKPRIYRGIRAFQEFASFICREQLRDRW